MTTEEMSNSLDTLLNSYNNQALFGDQTSRADIALDEYEKSLFLTQAQDAIVKNYFLPKTDPTASGFDGDERRQVDFSSLVTVTKPSISSNQSSIFDHRGIIYTLPKNLLLMLNEAFIVDGKRYVVKPISYRDYDRIMSKPYAQPLKKQCWRIFQNQNSEYDIESEIVPIQHVRDNLTSTKTYLMRVVTPTSTVITSYDIDESVNKLQTIDGVDVIWNDFKNNILVAGTYSLTNTHHSDVEDPDGYSYYQFTLGSTSYMILLDMNKTADTGATIRFSIESKTNSTYVIRYVRRPDPIILVDLPDDLTIDGESATTPCKLNPIIHMDIVNEAFRLAVISKGGGGSQQQTKKQ